MNTSSMKRIRGVACPKCESTIAHNIQRVFAEGTLVVAFVVSCHSCEHVWFEDLRTLHERPD